MSLSLYFIFVELKTSLMIRQPPLFPNICVIRWLVTAVFFHFCDKRIYGGKYRHILPVLYFA